MTTSISLLYVTYPNAETARDCARRAVEERLCACANIFAQHESVYEWQGKMEQTSEVAVIFKTASSRVAELMAWVAREHPFENPCIIELPVGQGAPPYMEWVARQSSGRSD